MAERQTEAPIQAPSGLTRRDFLIMGRKFGAAVLLAALTGCNLQGETALPIEVPATATPVPEPTPGAPKIVIPNKPISGTDTLEPELKPEVVEATATPEWDSNTTRVYMEPLLLPETGGVMPVEEVTPEEAAQRLQTEYGLDSLNTLLGQVEGFLDFLSEPFIDNDGNVVRDSVLDKLNPYIEKVVIIPSQFDNGQRYAIRIKEDVFALDGQEIAFPKGTLLIDTSNGQDDYNGGFLALTPFSERSSIIGLIEAKRGDSFWAIRDESGKLVAETDEYNRFTVGERQRDYWFEQSERLQVSLINPVPGTMKLREQISQVNEAVFFALKDKLGANFSWQEAPIGWQARTTETDRGHHLMLASSENDVYERYYDADWGFRFGYTDEEGYAIGAWRVRGVELPENVEVERVNFTQLEVLRAVDNQGKIFAYNQEERDWLEVQLSLINDGESKNIRQGPGTDYGVAATAQEGTFSVLEKTEQEDGNWFKVALAGLNTGWVREDLFDVTQEDLLAILDLVPVVEEIPPVPTPEAITSSENPFISKYPNLKVEILKSERLGEIQEFFHRGIKEMYGGVPDRIHIIQWSPDAAGRYSLHSIRVPYSRETKFIIMFDPTLEKGAGQVAWFRISCEPDENNDIIIRTRLQIDDLSQFHPYGILTNLLAVFKGASRQSVLVTADDFYWASDLRKDLYYNEGFLADSKEEAIYRFVHS